MGTFAEAPQNLYGKELLACNHCQGSSICQFAVVMSEQMVNGMTNYWNECPLCGKGNSRQAPRGEEPRCVALSCKPCQGKGHTLFEITPPERKEPIRGAKIEGSGFYRTPRQ